MLALARALCAPRGWALAKVYFYTGIPSAADDPFWHAFWSAKMASMGRQSVETFSRTLRYRTRRVKLPDGTIHTYRSGEEKGIDVRLALDVVRLARQDAYDVALLFSQDQDLSEVADEIRAIARDQGRWIKIASAFPCIATTRNRRGINKTDWIQVDRATYDACRDPYDHRPTSRRGSA